MTSNTVSPHTIDEILAHVWAGSYGLDREWLAVSDQFICDETKSRADRLKAYEKHCYEGFGCTVEEIQQEGGLEKSLDTYVQALNDQL